MQVNNQIIARDLGSTNGIYLNGERVKRQCRLKLGDVFMIGDLRFRLQSDPKSKAEVKEDAVPVRQKPAPEDALATLSSKPTPYMRGVPGGEMQIPVAIPEEGHDFVIEPSVPKMPSPRVSAGSDDVIPLGSDSAV